MYINKVMVFGNLTRDPEMRALPNGGDVTSFGIATNRVYKKADGSKGEQTEFHNIVVFGNQAKSCSQYLRKGSSTYVEGRLQTRSWDGEKGRQYRTEIIAERVQFGPRPKNSETSGGSESAEATDDVQPDSSQIQYPEEDINLDDIPF